MELLSHFYSEIGDFFNQREFLTSMVVLFSSTRWGKFPERGYYFQESFEIINALLLLFPWKLQQMSQLENMKETGSS